MKAKSFALLLGISTSFFVPILVAQDQNQPLRGYFKSFPLQGNTVEGAMNESASGTTVPLFSVVTTASRDKNKYTTTLMGGYWNISNLSGNQTTDIQTVVIPLVVTMPDGVVFDPTATAYDPNCNLIGVPLTLTQNSPLFQNASFTWGGTNVGTTQYVDAQVRAEFWNGIGIFACSGPGGGGSIAMISPLIPASEPEPCNGTTSSPRQPLPHSHTRPQPV